MPGLGYQVHPVSLLATLATLYKWGHLLSAIGASHMVGSRPVTNPKDTDRCKVEVLHAARPARFIGLETPVRRLSSTHKRRSSYFCCA